MLGKLIKNEFIGTSKSLLGVLSSAAAAIVLMIISYISGISWLGSTASFALVAIGFITFIMTFVMVIRNFYNTLYTNQGYLSFTLPVKCTHLLMSKFIVAFMWIIIGVVVWVGTIAIVVFYTKSKTSGMLDTIMGMAEGFQEVGSLPSVKLALEYLTALGVGYLITVISFVSFVFFSVTLANTRPFQNRQMLYSIVFFFGLYIFKKIVTASLDYYTPIGFALFSDRLKLIFTAKSAGLPEGAFLSMGIGGNIFTVILSVGLLFITGYIMEKKVNIK